MISLINKRNEITDTCNNMDESRKCPKSKKPDTKDYISSDSFYMKF